jgi:hypothetical protein
MVEVNESTLAKKFGLALDPPWTPDLYDVLDGACSDLVTVLGDIVPLWMQGLQIRLERMPHGGLTSRGLVRLNPVNLTKWTVVHELAHAWDFSSRMRLSSRMRFHTRSWEPPFFLRRLFPSNPHFWYHPGSLPPPCGIDKNFNKIEDFAEAVTAYVYPDLAGQKAIKMKMPYSKYGYAHFHETPRGQFIRELIEVLNKNALV